MGIAALIPCKSNLDVTCRLAQAAAKRGVYGKWAQDNLIQASQIWFAPAKPCTDRVDALRRLISGIKIDWMSSLLPICKASVTEQALRAVGLTS